MKRDCAFPWRTPDRSVVAVVPYDGTYSDMDQIARGATDAGFDPDAFNTLTCRSYVMPDRTFAIYLAPHLACLARMYRADNPSAGLRAFFEDVFRYETEHPGALALVASAGNPYAALVPFCEEIGLIRSGAPVP